MSQIRLLHRIPSGEVVFCETTSSNVPPYAILSHTWGKDEITFRDMEHPAHRSKIVSTAGWRKIQFCAEQAAFDGLQYFWVDTCCIDKRNSVELGAAINSMFRWYQNAARCYVYLSDVPDPEPGQGNERLDKVAFRNSRWFKRGWTLQELLAPKVLDFFTAGWVHMGNRESLIDSICLASQIDPMAIRGGNDLATFGVMERFAWARNRQTREPEDKAYSLFGIFGVRMTLLYGEGEDESFERLRRKIRKRIREQHRPSFEDDQEESVEALSHPVRRNYRRVFVTILYWADDRIEAKLEKITTILRNLYGYTVRWLTLTSSTSALETQERDDQIDDDILQIAYYIGGTAPDSEPARRGWTNVVAVPHTSPPSGHPPLARTILQSLIGIPYLLSDVLLILDCYLPDLSSDEHPLTANHLSEPGYEWARYSILLAGYESPSTAPGTFSDHLMSVLENFALAEQPHMASKPTNCRTIYHALAQYVFQPGCPVLNPILLGNEGYGSLIVSPLPDQQAPRME